MAERDDLLAAADLLRAGHDRMLERGRCPDGPRDSEGRECMVVALNAPRDISVEEWGVLDAAYDALRLVVAPAATIDRFNDDPATTDDMAFDAFTAAEKWLREEAGRCPA